MKNEQTPIRTRSLIGDCRGAVYAELALSFILLLPLFAGVVKVSLLLNSSIDLIQASRIITRSSFHAQAVSSGAELCGALTNLTSEALSSVGLDPLRYSIDVIPVENGEVDPEGGQYSQALQIVVSAPHSASALFHIPPFPAYVSASGILVSEMGACSQAATTQFHMVAVR